MAKEISGDLTPVDGDYAVIVSRYNEMITGKLLEGTLSTLRTRGVSEDRLIVTHVPGAWELPLAAQQVAARANVVAVICLGAVIRGETTHDQHINRQVSDSLGRLALEFELPVVFGLLTCNSLEQALNRAGGRVGNKGEECANTALEMTQLMECLRTDGEEPL